MCIGFSHITQLLINNKENFYLPKRTAADKDKFTVLKKTGLLSRFSLSLFTPNPNSPCEYPSDARPIPHAEKR
jgi:hypothetical protein